MGEGNFIDDDRYDYYQDSPQEDPHYDKGTGDHDNGHNENPEEKEDKEIDILELVYKLWARRVLILMWCMWGALAGLIIAFSIPKEYTTSVKLAPESKSGRANMSGGLGALASMAGISTSANSGTDAVYPGLYPDIVSSVPFATSLFEVPVTDEYGNHYTVKEYLVQEIRRPWWNGIMNFPNTVSGWFSSAPAPQEGTQPGEPQPIHHTDNFQLTPLEAGLVGMLRQRISASVDDKTSIITIEAKMQDPLVSAILADTVVDRLREYVTDYRTDKARQDLDYALKLNSEAQQEYYNAQQRLADYIDRNQNLATRSAMVKQERLENEASLAFNLYNETSLQVQNAKSRVQETTPVYTKIAPATVPMQPISPKKGLIIGGCTFLAFVACCGWILFAKPLVSEYKKKVKTFDDNPEDEA